MRYYDYFKHNKNENKIFKTIPLKSFQKKLKDDEIFIDYFNSGFSHCLIITNSDTKFFRLDDKIRDETEKIDKSILSFDYLSFVESGDALFQILFSKIKLNKYKRIIVSPQYFLEVLPFECLLKSKKNCEQNDYRKLDYLVKTHEIEYCLSPLFFRNSKPKSYDFEISVFTPNFPKTFSSLPFSKLFAKKVNKEMKGKIFDGKKADLVNFHHNSSTILHLNSHSIIDNQNAENSFILFKNKRLNVSEVKPNRAKLIVLNTCSSGNGVIRAGDGSEGFLKSFIYKGNPTVMTNLWAVDDKKSNELFYSFYKFLDEGKSTVMALNSAKRTAIEKAINSKSASPYYWGAPRVVGEEINFNYSTQGFVLYLILFGSATVLIFIMAYLYSKKKGDKRMSNYHQNL